MIKQSSKYIFTVLGLALLLVTFSSVRSYSLSCFPTCSSTDGRFLSITEGAGFATLTPSTLNIRLIVPAGTEVFSIGIFDGDMNGNTDGVFNWDASQVSDEPFSYTLVADPDRDNEGAQVFQVLSTVLLNNEWVDFSIESNPLALDENGNYVYTLKIVKLTNAQSLNAFKVRSDPGVLEIDEIFSFVAQMTSLEDILTIYPDSDFSMGPQPHHPAEATYDGTFTFFFDIPEPASQLVFWDGDSDRGSFDDMSTWDTDDQNTPNAIPDFAPPEADTVAEGINAPDPFDDIDPSGENGFHLLYRRVPAVTYKLIAPDGQEWENLNPSGSQEWENFVISTLTDDPNVVDFNPSEIPAGTYEIRFEGLDMANLVSINPLFPLVLRGEGPPPPGGAENGGPVANVPTMSEWGLLAVAVVMGLIGIIVVRRKQQLS